MHIQQGDDRQYFSKNEQEINVLGEVVNSLGQGAQNAFTIAQKADETKLADYQVDLSTKFLEKNNEINIKYQTDPINPQREKELKEAFNSLSSQYKVGVASKVQWEKIKNNIYNNYKEYNAQWQLKQQETNATNDLKNGYETLVNQVSMMGLKGFGVNEIRLVYKNGIDGLSRSANTVLGSEVANQFLKDSNHDIMTTYISALAVDNPLVAQKLINDESVVNDIGRAETIDKLKQYINSSIINQNKQVAFDELGNSLRAMKSDEADKILEGRADLNQVSKFIENNKKLPEGSKDLILGIYGIGSKTEYYYDKDKGKITKAPMGGYKASKKVSSNDSLVALSKLTNEQKLEIASNLETKLNNMFYFDDDEIKVVKAKNGNQSVVLEKMENLAKMQGAIDTACSAGIISKQQRKEYMNKYIEPMTNYFEANLSELDEKNALGLMGAKLGYEKIKKAFSNNGKKTLTIAQRKDLLTAQGYYYSALDTARKKYGLASIYDIETKLHSRDQQEIYKAASDGAIEYAKRHSEHPELFFKKEYPLLYQEGVAMFGFEDGNIVARNVARKIYGASKDEKTNVKEVMGSAISDMHALKMNKNLMTKLKLYEEKNTVQKPIKHTSSYGNANYYMDKYYKQNLEKYNASIAKRKKELGISDSDLKQTMKESGLNESQVISLLEMQKRGVTLVDLYKD